MQKSSKKKEANLTYEDFRVYASDDSKSLTEKIGFHDRYRLGKDAEILADLSGKLPSLNKSGSRILDIGCGCASLTLKLIDNAASLNQQLHLIDSPEMLANLPRSQYVQEFPGMYPRDFEEFTERQVGVFDVILVYSVLQYIIQETAAAVFLDRTLRLLAPGGRLLLGDVPNRSKRDRFFSSDAGIAFHQKENSTTEKPKVLSNGPLDGEIDDSLIFFLLMRARVQGYESYLIEQGAGLPMANRREDLLFVRASDVGK